MLDPSIVVGRDVVPSWFKLVADGPHEVTFYSIVENINDTLAKRHDFIIREVIGVDSTLTIPDKGVLSIQTRLAIGTKLSSCAVEVSSVGIHVGCRAFNALTGT